MYFISVLALIITSIFFFIVGPGKGSNMIYWFIDLPSLLPLILFNITMLLSAGLLKDFNNAFRFVGRTDQEESMAKLRRSVEAVRLARRVTLAAGGFDLFFQFILILGRMDSPEMLGPYIAIGMLGLLYAFAFVLLLLPMESRLQIKLQNMLQD